jgi:N-methylhydantoinase A
MLDIRTIGAGGGSIAWIDKGGSIRVGPRSAGSLPGPACYGRGGRRPTVTDANVVLGRISNQRIFGKEIQIDATLSETAISSIAEQIHLDLIQTASGIITIVNENMAASLKQISLDRGRDPRDFSLVAFGGAGALHACFLAKTLGIERVYIPCHEGVFSAYGAVVMDFKNDHEKTFYCPVAEVDLDELNRQYHELDQKGFGIMQRQGVARENVRIARSAQIRYIGQTYEVETPVPEGEIDSKALENTLRDFHKEHAKEYGFSEETFPAAFVNLRSTAIGKIDKPQIAGIKVEKPYLGSEALESRRVYFDDHGFVKTSVYDRQRLPAGFQVNGPAILEDASATAIIAPDMRAEVDDYGNILVTL